MPALRVLRRSAAGAGFGFGVIFALPVGLTVFLENEERGLRGDAAEDDARAGACARVPGLGGEAARVRSRR